MFPGFCACVKFRKYIAETCILPLIAGDIEDEGGETPEHSDAEEGIDETNEASTELELDEVSTRCQQSVLVIEEDMAEESIETKKVEPEDTNNESREGDIHKGIN